MRRHAPGLLLVIAVTAAAYALHSAYAPFSPLTGAVLLGLLAGNLLPMPATTASGVGFAGRRVMRVGVALLGAEVSAQTLVAMGLGRVLGIITVVALTIIGVTALARAMGLDADLGLLIGVGYGICGASAVAAARSQTRASDEQVSYAVALVALCGTLSIAVLPALGVFLGMGDVEFGRWAGAAVHDVGQVVATASTRSDTALSAAIVVKLARVALLAPTVLLLSLRARRVGYDGSGKAPAVLPLFVVGFLGLAVLRSVDLLPTEVAGTMATLAKLAMAMGLAALGLQVRWADLRRVGGRPLVLGLLAWVLVAGLALAMVSLLG